MQIACAGQRHPTWRDGIFADDASHIAAGHALRTLLMMAWREAACAWREAAWARDPAMWHLFGMSVLCLYIVNGTLHMLVTYLCAEVRA